MYPKCANCGIEIRWQPTVVSETVYCCVGCSNGGPCTCDYDHLPRPGTKAVLARRLIQVSVTLANSDETETTSIEECHTCKVTLA